MNSKNVSASIIIPHLNQAHMLERCLNLLAPQLSAYPGAEVIVVDNGSKVLPEAICARHDFVTLVTEAEPGPGPARNAGIAKAKSNLLAFIDADCTPGPEWLSSIVTHFGNSASEDIIGGDVRISMKDPGSTTMLEAYESVFAYRQQEYINRLGFSGTGNLAMRRGAYERVGPFGGIAIAEDRDWGQRATTLGFRIAYVPQMMVYHPARQTFVELTRKWDRHISHDFEERTPGMGGSAAWVARAVVIAASGVLDVHKILTSDRIQGVRQRNQAFAVLLRIRLYRAWRMLTIMGKPGSTSSRSWNRQ